jgi:predicted lipoprotein with Yx(FWY)xxD motif
MLLRSRTVRTTGADLLLGPLALLGVLSVVGAGCGSAAAPSKDAAAPATTAGGGSGLSSRSGVTVRVSRTDYGNVLVDGNGRALYLFTRERTPQTQCYGACAGNWPPFLTAGRPVAAIAARASLLGTTRRRDGSTQVTYGGHPLY